VAVPEIEDAMLAIDHRGSSRIRLRRGQWAGAGVAGAWAGAAAIAALAIAAVAAPLVAPHPPNAIDLSHALAGSSFSHLLGTDGLGRDILSRLIYGARTSLLGPLLAVLISTGIAVPISLVVAYRRGFADALLSRIWDAMFGFPTLLLAIAIVATFGPGFWTATLAVSIIYIPILARVTRSSVLLEREKPYVQACRLQGYGQLRIVFAHVLPNISGVVGAQAVLNFGYALLDLAGLAFLGFAVQPPTPDWGVMLTDGREGLIQGAYFQVVSASLTIMLTVLAFNVVGYELTARAKSRR
jgi:ABC-type dipeptide/oligopeptide/nickel transport system permease subunit